MGREREGMLVRCLWVFLPHVEAPLGGHAYRAGLDGLQAMSESFAADYGGDLMDELLGLSGFCRLGA